MKKNFYLTTPIFYPNGELHLGHVYTLALSDVIARFKLINGYNVFFQTGSDEHGEKISKTALLKGLKPIELVDLNVSKFKKLFENINLMNNYYFMRTSFDFHEEEVKKIFEKLLKNGDVYEGSYEGNYCVNCEEYNVNSGKCDFCSSDLVKISEDCFFLKVEKYREKLLDIYKENLIKVLPNYSLNELFESFLGKEMPDLCITRKKINWGIEVPNNPNLTFYVWFDALCNYVSSPYGKNFFSNQNDEILQIIGKDIIRFHLVYWPIILLSLGKRLPNTIISHGWILHSGFKMSKSKGNVIDPFSLIEKYSSDNIRSYLCSKVIIGNDGNISEEKISEFYNDFFVNKFGNLFSRTISMIEKYFSWVFPFDSSPFSNKNTKLSSLKSYNYINKIEIFLNLYKESMDKFEVSKGFLFIEKIILESNKFITDFLPWKVFDNKDYLFLSEIIVCLVYSIKIISFMLWPFAPEGSEKTLSNIGLEIRDIEFSELLSFSSLEKIKIKKQKNHIFKRI